MFGIVEQPGAQRRLDHQLSSWPDDGEDLARQLSKYEDQATSTDLTSLPKYRAYVRLLIDGMPSRPFTMKTLPPPRCDDGRSTKIRNVSRRRYGVAATRS